MSNTAFNVGVTAWTHRGVQHNFKTFFKKNKTLLTALHTVFFIASIVILIACSKTIQDILKTRVFNYFLSFNFSIWFSNLFHYSALVQFNKIDTNDNLFKAYQVTLMAMFIAMSINMCFLFLDFFDKRKIKEKHRLSLGVFINPELNDWSKNIMKSFADCISFMLTAVIGWLFLSISIIGSLRASNNFEHNFFFAVLQISLIVWIFVGFLIAYNYYVWYKEFFEHFVQYLRYKNKLDEANEKPTFLMSKILKESFLFMLFIFTIFVSLPYDLFFIYMIAKHCSWTKKTNSKETHIKEKFIY